MSSIPATARQVSKDFLIKQLILKLLLVKIQFRGEEWTLNENEYENEYEDVNVGYRTAIFECKVI